MRFLIGLMLISSVAWAQQSIGEVQGKDASVRGAVVLKPGVTTVMSGSQISAGDTPANLKLTRGGDLRVCSESSITVTGSSSGRETLIGLNRGSIETHYSLSSSADSIITADFRFLLPGPGSFHFAIGIKGNGDTCVKSLPGNSASLVANEVFGEGTHQVKPGESVVFRNGKVDDPIVESQSSCGCQAYSAVPPAAGLSFPEQESQKAAAAVSAGLPPPDVQPAPPAVTGNKNEIKMQVDAPVVFRGEDLPISVAMLRRTTPVAVPWPSTPQPIVKAEETNPPVKKKWYQRLGAALAGIFR